MLIHGLIARLLRLAGFGPGRRGLAVPVALLLANAALSAPAHFVLSSPDPLVAEHMPETYTANAFGCTGRNASPPLQWKGAPSGTLSYVVTLFDRDERSTPSGWWHWVVYDIPNNVDSLYIGAGALHGKALPAPAMQGRSDLGEDAYHGPCPAKGDPPHRYVFTIYALKVAKLPVPADSSGAMVTSTAQEYVLGKAIFIAHHGRRKQQRTLQQQRTSRIADSVADRRHGCAFNHSRELNVPYADGVTNS